MRTPSGKVASVALLVLAFAGAGPAFAAGEVETGSGNMTIDQAVDLLGLFDDAPAPRSRDGEVGTRSAAPPAAVAATASAAPAKAPPAFETARSEGPSLADLPFAGRLQAARKDLPKLLRGALDDLRAGRFSRRAQGVIAGVVLSGLLLVIAASRFGRGRGDVSVCIDYPSELRGVFTVRLATRPAGTVKSGRIKTPADAVRAKERASSSSRTEHHMVARETQFREMSCQRYFVTVDGFLQTGESDDVISTHFEELEVTPRMGRTVRVTFDLRPRACPVEVKVLWDRRPVAEAFVALRGVPGSMRFARNGPVQLSLNQGQHTVVAGSGDRIAEHVVDVRSFQPMHVSADLADREHLLFTGCPPAVEPYLNGDIVAAARALERDGQTEVSHLILARFHQERGQRERAAKHYEQAGRFTEAAELFQAITQFEKAAVLFEQAGDDERAGENYRSAGKLLRAGDAYARAAVYDSAVECFRKAGDTARWIEALAKQGEIYQAAVVALDQGDRTRAIQCLSAVPLSDPNYPEAVLRLGEAYQAQGHLDLALHKLEELVATRGDEAPVEAFDRLASILEQAGDFDRAMQALERLRTRDPAFPNVATRIEELRKRSTGGKRDEATLVNAASGFGDESRYEILEEVGRGGMGIVFRARDRRLGRVVALKRLPDNLRDHPKAVELFLREARAAAALNHPNIVTLFDAGQEGGTFYITMELLEGLPLHRILRQRGHLSPANVAKIGGQVATGLDYAHEKGIVHRDIKTANLFFTDKKVVKVMDFGLAKMVEEVRRSTTVIGGTPYYMAPEQAAGENVDARADLYALGVTFYELLTGHVPFREGDVAFHHRHTPPPDPREEVVDVPAEFAELILEMMAKDPAERTPSAGTVCERLYGIAANL